MDEKKYIKVSLGTVVCLFIIVILIIALGITYYLGFVKNKDNNAVTNEQKNITSDITPTNNTIKNQDKEQYSDMAKQLYSLIEGKTTVMLSYPAHNNKVGNVSKLSDADKIYIAYTSLKEEDFSKTYEQDKFEKIIGENYDIYEYYEDSNGKFMYFVSKEQILEKARQLFGENITITNYDEDISVGIFYKYGNYYQVKDVPASGGDIYHWCWESDYFFYTEGENLRFETCGFSAYDKYEVKDNEIIVYEYYINAYQVDDYDNMKYASTTSNYDLSTRISLSYNEFKKLENNQWDSALKEKAGYYKHTFKKDINGNYCWVSSEML